MRHPAPLPAGSALPLRSPPPPPTDEPRLRAAPAAVADFNSLLHALHPDAPHVDAPALESVARWLLALPSAQAEEQLQARLGRIAELRRLAADPDWPLEPALAQRIDRLLAYVDDARDLIPDGEPLVGRLDDALLVELAWPMLAEELEDWRDFCSFRDEQGGHPTRERWYAARLEEGALWEQMHRVRRHHYVDHGPLAGGLRVT